jgi:hypothetical protein
MEMDIDLKKLCQDIDVKNLQRFLDARRIAISKTEDETWLLRERTVYTDEQQSLDGPRLVRDA